MKATTELLNEIKKAGTITEQQINLLKMRSNKQNRDLWNYDLNDIKVTPTQTEKSLKWLKNLYKTPNGKERKNNPFGFREIGIIESKDACFYFSGFENVGNYFHCHTPVYVLCGGGYSFEYYVKNGKIQIIG